MGRREWAWAGWLIVGAPLLIFLIGVPVTLAMHSGGIWHQLSTESSMEAMKLSLWTTSICLVITMLMGTPLAYAVARWRSPLRRLADALIDLPVVLPPAAAGIALLLAFGRTGPIGGWLEAHGVTVVFSTGAVVLAQLFVSAPIYIRAAVVGFASLDKELEQSAAIDGASRLAVLRTINLPLMRRALAGGAATSWARALGEFGATILFAGNLEGRTQTMPLAIYAGFEGDLQSAIAMSCVLLAVALVVLLVAKLAFN